MIRSGRAGFGLFALSVAVGVAAGFFLAARVWLAAAALGGAWIPLMAAVIFLLRRTDPRELERRRVEGERFMDAWARGIAQASGAWRPRGNRPK